MLQCRHLLSSHFPFAFPFPFPSNHHSLTFLHKPTSLQPISAHLRTRPGPWLSQLPEPTTTNTTTTLEEGPAELPPSTPSIFATDDDPSTLQVATSVLLTGAISVFLFRALRRRAKRAKELRFRSTGAKKSLKEEALESLKAMTPTSAVENSPPSPVQALLGGISAGVIALILYKFTTTIEASLGRQTLSDNISVCFLELLILLLVNLVLALHVRQITITIRTIINGLCYLATFVFGINSIGLMLYSVQLAINSFMGDSTSDETKNKDEGQLSSPNPTAGDSSETNSNTGNQSSDNTK
ncbi:hypothetical protein RJ639_039834 [Escallonia herrerae]|uniref:Transmembrane protein n=1 Tax=Escallonia herrerae TaxID=1293975 RepID=A0AA88WLY9_9ASTE|nr:hypothetical protein RJ639_039834 [Escallonia herrerae]